MKKIKNGIFIASCSKMLEKERSILSNTIISYGYHPVQMENDFLGSNLMKSIDIDIEKIKESEAVIFILSFLYGEVIGDKIVNIKNCPLINDNDHKSLNCSCSGGDLTCTISFTEFEYCYAKKLGKPIFVIYNSEYKNDSAFETALSTDSYNFRRDYYNKYENKKEIFLKTVTQYHCYPYKTTEKNSFEQACNNAVAATKELMEKNFNKKHQSLSDKFKFIDKGDYIKLKVPIGNIRMIETVCFPNKMNWYDANKYAYDLRKGGLNGWRLPTKEELEKIYKIRYIFRISGNNFDWFWSSSNHPNFTSRAWAVNFIDGNVNTSNKFNDLYVRCVRDAEQPDSINSQ